MHTTTILTADHGEIRIYHNSDWSGEVKITWGEVSNSTTITIPGQILVDLSMIMSKSIIMDAINELMEEL